MAAAANASPLLISLRPVGAHASLRRAAARHGLGLLAVSPWRLCPRRDEASRQALRHALAAPVVVFTSPAAVRAAAALRTLQPCAGAIWLAVGAGSARALHDAGVSAVQQPARMDSEGLLALPALARAEAVGLVTAPGGRGLIAAELQHRGCELRRADVYERQAWPLSAALLRRLQALPAQAGVSVLALSSAEALRLTLSQLPAPLADQWRAQPVVAASDRLAELARAQGFLHVHRAKGPLPAQLAEAAARAVARG